MGPLRDVLESRAMKKRVRAAYTVECLFDHHKMAHLTEDNCGDLEDATRHVLAEWMDTFEIFVCPSCRWVVLFDSFGLLLPDQRGQD